MKKYYWTPELPSLSLNNLKKVLLAKDFTTYKAWYKETAQGIKSSRETCEEMEQIFSEEFLDKLCDAGLIHKERESKMTEEKTYIEGPWLYTKCLDPEDIFELGNPHCNYFIQEFEKFCSFYYKNGGSTLSNREVIDLLVKHQKQKWLDWLLLKEVVAVKEERKTVIKPEDIKIEQDGYGVDIGFGPGSWILKIAPGMPLELHRGVQSNWISKARITVMATL